MGISNLPRFLRDFEGVRKAVRMSIIVRVMETLLRRF